MRILYAFPEALPFERARSYQAVRTASAMADSGLDIVLMHPQGHEDPFLHYGLPRPSSLTVIPVSRSLPWPLSRITSNRIFYRRVIHRLSSLKPLDVIFTRHLKFAAIFLEHGPKVPLVYEAHEVFSDTAPLRKRASRAIEEKRVVENAAVIVANSGATATRLQELFGPARRIVIIPNGVDRVEACPEKDWSDAKRKVVYAGSLFPWKGVDDLIAAGAWLTGYRIEIVGGETGQLDELRSRIPPGGAEFSFSGRLPHSAVMSRLADNCIAVLPNRDDPDSAFTSPIKLFEYIASGCAVVASDLPVLREILGDQEAVWSRPGDAESLARAISSIASTPDRAAAMGRRLHELSGGYTWLSRGRRLKALFASLTSK